jgi:hypothetical protein
MWWVQPCRRECMHPCLFPFLSVKTFRIYSSLIIQCVRTYLFLSVHFYELTRQHTLADTCRDPSHTLELWWWRVWHWFTLPPHTNIHTNIHTSVYVYTYICFLIVYLSEFTRHLFCLTLCFSSIQGTLVDQQPVVGPATRHFCRSFILQVSVCFSHGYLESTVLYKHQDTRTYMFRQTHRHIGLISEIVAAHPLAHVVHTRKLYRGENIVVFILH